jgi:hypothetical protein
MSGKEDEIIPRAATRRFVQALPSEAGGRSLAFYRHGYHMLLRDLDGPVVVADAADWMHDRRAPLPSGADRGGVAALLDESNRTPVGGG